MPKDESKRQVEKKLVEIASKDAPLTKQEISYFKEHAEAPLSYYSKNTPQDGGDY